MLVLLVLLVRLKSNLYLFLYLPSVFVVYSYFKRSKHILNILLYLEFATITSIVYGLMGLGGSSRVTVVLLVFFTLSVCEACVGISILVKISRASGNDKLKAIV